jgi:septum site-determining protein MinC
VRETAAPAEVRFWNRSFTALVMAPEFPMSDWFAALDRQLEGAPDFFRRRPIVVDLSAAAEVDARTAASIVMEGLEARGLWPMGVEGVDPIVLAGTPWARLPVAPRGRDTVLEAPPPPAAASLLIERPVRSGQSIVFEAGDVTIVGAVASGAEVVAGGSIHVYGPLRGRAIAGLRAGGEARIFCRRLEAELVGVDRLYRTAEHWGPGLHGRAVQVRCDRGGLRLSALD